MSPSELRDEEVERVSVARVEPAAYPETPPFDPDTAYPELAQLATSPVGTERNAAYQAVRESLRQLGLDREHFGTSEWNPLRDVVRPGERVVVKPNWVLEGHHDDDSWQQIITHGAVLRAVIDYAAIALQGRGRISLADGPMQSADFARISERCGLDALKRHVARAAPSIEFECLDLRDLFLETRDDVVVRRTALAGDPRGAVRVDLGERSALYRFRGEGRLYGADYDTAEVNRHHLGSLHEYLLSGTAMEADVILDVPKLKTHQKVGITLSLKGVVGLNCGRNWLPHRTQGTPDQGGDQFRDSGFKQRFEASVVRAFELGTLRWPSLVSPLYRLAKQAGKRLFGSTDRTVRGGGWYGNDTLWRMVLDINRALVFGDRQGELAGKPQRRRFCVVDGLVAGEGTGPIYATPAPVGVVLAGRDPVAVDVVCTELVGFDHAMIPMLRGALARHELPLTAAAPGRIRILGSPWGDSIAALRAAAPFQLAEPNGWIGHLKRPAPRGHAEPTPPEDR